MTKHGDRGVTWDESFGRKGTVIGETLRIHGECLRADPKGPLQILTLEWRHTAGELAAIVVFNSNLLDICLEAL